MSLAWRVTIGALALAAGSFLVARRMPEPRRPLSAGAPLAFQANHGQTDARVDFLARGAGYTLFVTPGEAVFVLTNSRASGIVLRMTFEGADAAARAAGLEQLPGSVNYLVGSDPTKWQTDVPLFRVVQYDELYPGIALRYAGDQQRVACEFLVRPGADPRRIVLRWQGADSLDVDARRGLVLHTAVGTIRQAEPEIYQHVNGARRQIAGGYVRKNAQQVGVEVARYDAGRPLAIRSVVPFLLPSENRFPAR